MNSYACIYLHLALYSITYWNTRIRPVISYNVPYHGLLFTRQYAMDYYILNHLYWITTYTTCLVRCCGLFCQLPYHMS